MNYFLIYNNFNLLLNKMNKILLFALFFALSNCVLKISECKANGNINGNLVYINTASNDYVYNKEFDWTDEDSIDFEVPIVYTGPNTITSENFIPLFINASTVGIYNETSKDSYGTKTIKASEYPELTDVKIYNKYQVYYPFDADVSNERIFTKVQSTKVKANENDVTQKFIKYFGFAYCTGVGEARIVTTNILATFNNGNYFSVSKMLLAALALLFF